MLRKLRIFFASLFFVGFALLFLDLSGFLHTYLSWLARTQLSTAILSANVVVLVALLLLTLLCGCVYCSVLCPLGLMQDLCTHLSRRWHKHRFHYRKPHTVLRYVVLALFVVAVIIGFGALAALIDPYGLFGRIATNLFQPIYIGLNNLLALLAEHLGSYAFYHVDVWVSLSASLLVAILSFLLIAFLAVRYGRLWCNTICPIGSLLGLLSRFAIFKPVINSSKCIGCSKCANHCRSSCINPLNRSIDYSRCVACMDCISQCHAGAISLKASLPFSSSRKGSDTAAVALNECSSQPADPSRRRFITTSAMVAAGAAVASHAQAVEGGLAVIEDKRVPLRKTPLIPFGSLSLEHFTSKCCSCQLCVSECPSHILKPSSSFSSFLQPHIDYSNGLCPPSCTRCSHVCPTSAISPIDAAAKSAISIGFAVVLLDNCLAYRDGVSCDACSRHCPAAAIHLVPKDPTAVTSPMIPAVDENRCLGCGACEYYCPSRPFSAIYVEGREVHSSC